MRATILCRSKAALGLMSGELRAKMMKQLSLKIALFLLVPVTLEINTLRYLFKSELEHRK